jgi:hypothetical protein
MRSGQNDNVPVLSYERPRAREAAPLSVRRLAIALLLAFFALLPVVASWVVDLNRLWFDARDHVLFIVIPFASPLLAITALQLARRRLTNWLAFRAWVILARSTAVFAVLAGLLMSLAISLVLPLVWLWTGGVVVALFASLIQMRADSRRMNTDRPQRT